MSLRRWGGLTALALLAAVPPLTAPPAQADGFWLFGSEPTPAEELAEALDEVEKHIDEYGSIVAKQPDIWGEARLTKYRREYEEVLAKRKDEFEDTINGALGRSDQAFLASALALQAAAGGGGGGGGLGDDDGTAAGLASTVNILSSTSDANSDATSGGGDGGGGGGGGGGPDARALIDTAAPNFERTPLGGLIPSELAPGGIRLEPVLSLDQHSRYLNHLHELRRINDGDDTSDSPGYALNLVRIPVSILPGEKTRQGYGAEITVTAEPYLSDELLPMTFRNLVVNDLVDQIGFPLTKFLNSEEGIGILKELAAIREEERQDIQQALQEGENKDAAEIEEAYERYGAGDDNRGSLQQNLEKANVPEASAERLANKAERRDAEQDRLFAYVNERLANIKVPAVAATRSRVMRLPVPASQLLWVFGPAQLRVIADSVNDGLRSDPISKELIHLPDVSSVLESDLLAAYEFLAARPDLWCFCEPQLATAVRRHEHAFSIAQDLAVTDPEEAGEGNIKVELSAGSKFVTERRRDFLIAAGEQFKEHVVVALAWAIVVESALLNERLIEDMREVASAKGCGCMPPADGLPFFLPNPPPEARAAFNEYVRCRWPIHVFALDPVTQDQNIADAFSMRREMQLALSIAFSTGQISADQFTRYARRIELDAQTVALNRTVVSFSHGSDTFGWRFHPRFQTPEIESNCAVVGRDMLIGGPRRDQLIKQYRLEPGIRECVALVLMPSFVPYATFDFRSNWFELTDPDDRELDLEEALELSKSVGEARRMTACGPGDHTLRGADLKLLMRTIDQLEARLPLQTTQVQIPYENTLGGFELFATGVTDLAPELKGFYGEPGWVRGQETMVFLVGNSFSVHETRVIAGNRDVTDHPNTKIISRQVYQIVIPAEAHEVNGHIDVHVATPYGVSNHLLIPVADPPSDRAAQALTDHLDAFHPTRFDWADSEVEGCLCFDDCRRLKKLCLYQEIAIENFSGDPFAEPVLAEFAAWVYADGTEQKFAKPIGPICVSFSDGKALVNGHGDTGEFLTQLGAVLSDGSRMADTAETLVIDGYLRFPDTDPAFCPAEAATGRSRPMIRLATPLVLKIHTCEGDDCAKDGCAKSIECVTPAGPPLPAEPTSNLAPKIEPAGNGIWPAGNGIGGDERTADSTPVNYPRLLPLPRE